ncbi:MAG TPA: hypothetical protein VN442_21115 [Bryobacteraceae bacterium]|nr:hypothetical protein [Bryobacteraceae bacterium]
MARHGGATLRDGETQRDPRVFLNLDWNQMGVGGIDSWGANAYPMAPYRIDSSEPRRYRYRLTPIDGVFGAKAREIF